MRDTDIIHNWIILFVIGLGMCSLCVGYAASADTGAGKGTGIKVLGYAFTKEYEDDFSIKLRSDLAKDNTADSTSGVNPLEAFIEYNYKTLNISGVESFGLRDFINGKVNLAIDYRMIRDKDRDGAGDAQTGTYDLGNIPFFLSGDKPYWRLVNRNGAWGIGIPELGIPEEIFKLIPENLTGLSGYNNIRIDPKGVVKGTITIGRFPSVSGAVPEINLSSLKLSDAMNREIMANREEYSILEIMANYYFSVPFGLDRETSDTLLDPAGAVNYILLAEFPQVQGKVTLKTQVKVIHEIE